MAAYWHKSHATMLNTTLLPSVDGGMVAQWLERRFCEDAEMAALNPITIQWLHQLPCETTDGKMQNWKLAGCAKAFHLGSFVFAIDEVERVGRWGDVEGLAKPRLEHRVATGHLPSSKTCADLHRAAELVAAQVFVAISTASGKQTTTSTTVPSDDIYDTLAIPTS